MRGQSLESDSLDMFDLLKKFFIGEPHNKEYGVVEMA